MAMAIWGVGGGDSITFFTLTLVYLENFFFSVKAGVEMICVTCELLNYSTFMVLINFGAFYFLG